MAAGAGGSTHQFGWLSIVVSFFSGTGAAIVAALVAGPTVVPVETRTVRAAAPAPKTVIKYVRLGRDGDPCSGSRVAGGPPYEPNDVIAEAYGPLRAGEPLDSSLEPSQSAVDEDVDFYAFCTQRSSSVIVAVRETARTQSYPAPVIRLLDESGKTLKESTVDDDATVGTLRARLTPDRYYIRIANGPSFGYELRVDADKALSPVVPRAARR